MKYPITVIFCLIAPAATAQFKDTTPDLPTEFSPLVCGPLSVVPPSRDDDPVHMIFVTPSFKDGNSGPLASLNINHHTVFGRTFNRSDQYTGDYLTQTPGKLEIVWRGSLLRNRAVKMIGRVWNESSNGRWYYSEYIEDNGRPKMKMLAGCHVQQGE